MRTPMLLMAIGTLWGQTGPAVGFSVPDFEAPDQNSIRRSLQSIMGQKGAMLVFFRSADW